jgi:DNA-binding GntR family transcriptional regulator
MSSEMLYRILRSRIENGQLPVGSEMPTEEKLTETYRLSRGTVRVALQRLADDGYLRAGQGRKRVIQRRTPLRLERLRIASKQYSEFALSAPRGSSSRRSPSFGEYLRSLDLRPADIVLHSTSGVACYTLAEEPRFDVGAHVSEALQISPGAMVHWILRLQWAVIVASLVPDVPQDFLVPGGLTQLYEQRGIRRDRVSTSYCPTRATKSEATYLRVGTGAPLIEERRVSYCRQSGRKEVPYEYLLCLYPERVALTYDWLDALTVPTPRRRRKANS